MDAKKKQLEEKRNFHLEQAASITAEIQTLELGNKVPHFDDIEIPAHELGKKLSQAIQRECTQELAMKEPETACCPECNSQCDVEVKTRNVHSMDGPIELTEPVAHCRRCRRSFFPSTSNARV